jgi:hypothetical protein
MGKITIQKRAEEDVEKFFEEMKSFGVPFLPDTEQTLKRVLWFKFMMMYYLGQGEGLDSASLIVKGGKRDASL